LKDELNLYYTEIQFVPRSKHSSSPLQKPVNYVYGNNRSSV